MNKDELMKEILENASKEEMKDFLFKVVKEIPETKNQKIVGFMNETFKKEVQDINIENLEKKIKNIEESFELIDTSELQFHSETYEIDDYDDWYDNYETSYSDPEGLRKIIEDAYNLAIILMTKKDYQNAKKILDLILFTTYPIANDDCNDIDLYDIRDIIYFELVDIDLKKICKEVLYITLMISNNKCEEIYKYYESSIFKDIKLENAFHKDIKDLGKFLDDWVPFLSKKEDKISFRLLTEILEYSKYANYKEVLELNQKTHPQLYLFVLEHLMKSKKYQEIVEIGSAVIHDMEDTIKSEMSLLIASAYKKVDSNYNIGDYLYMALESNPSIPNLIRIINNGYLEKYREKIDLIKEKLDKKIRILFYFFTF